MSKGRKMSKKRSNRSKDFKFIVAIEAVKGEKQILEIAEEYQVHPNQVSAWKKYLLENGAELFSPSQKKAEKELEAQRERLYQTVGKQQVTIDWLKKNLGIKD